MKVSVIGLGHIGIVTASCLAELGHKVIAIDQDQDKINRYIQNESDVHEPGLNELISKNIKKGKLLFSHTDNFAENLGDASIITVGTPPLADGTSDLSQVESALNWVLTNRAGIQTIIMKSTVPPGTGIRFAQRTQGNHRILYFSCPEFLSEGNAIHDFFNPHRIIVGSDNSAPEHLIKKIHGEITAPYFFTDTTTAEMIKYASNVFLSTKISFINSVANLCQQIGANIDDVQKGMGLDPRIGNNYLSPGVGYGGSCLPKDTLSFANIMANNHIENDLIKSVIKINESQKRQPFRYLKSRVKSIKNLKVGILGLSFKPNTDDVRESPAIFLINKLVKAGASVTAYDPFANAKAKETILNEPLPHFTGSIEECLNATSVVFVMHTWEEFDNVDWAYMNKIMRSPKIIYDGRNSLDPNLIRSHNFEYVSIGKR